MGISRNGSKAALLEFSVAWTAPATFGTLRLTPKERNKQVNITWRAYPLRY